MITDELVRRAVQAARRVDDLVLPEVGGWQYIAETILAAPAASVTLDNIPGIYQALVLFIEARTTRAATADTIVVQFNGDAGNNYDHVAFYADAAGAQGSFGGRAGTSNRISPAEAANSRADNFGPAVVWLPSYARDDREKWHLTSIAGRFEDRNVDGDITLYNYVGAWRDTSAITSILLAPLVGPNFTAGSKFTLYGIF